MEAELSERLRKYRKARNLTQQELADKLGVSGKSVSRWESGVSHHLKSTIPQTHAYNILSARWKCLFAVMTEF